MNPHLILSYLLEHLERGGTVDDFESAPRAAMSPAEHAHAVRALRIARVRAERDREIKEGQR